MTGSPAAPGVTDRRALRVPHVWPVPEAHRSGARSWAPRRIRGSLSSFPDADFRGLSPIKSVNRASYGQRTSRFLAIALLETCGLLGLLATDIRYGQPSIRNRCYALNLALVGRVAPMKTTNAVVDDFLTAYRREFDYYQEASRLCAQLCEQELRGNGKRVIVTSRAKAPDRLAEKLRRREEEQKKDYRTSQEIYDDIVDLSGVRIALYFPGDLQDVDKIIRNTFRLVREPKTFPDGSPKKYKKQFDGYHATHYLVGLKPEKLGSDQQRYAEARIEIQVASVLMHGWAEVEHDLVYKPLSGELSDDEYAILDEMNGLVLTGEIALRRLQVAFDKRVNQADQEFTNHYELAAFLHRELRLATRDAAEPDMGRVDLLFQLLRHYQKNRPGVIKPLLSAVTTDADYERPIGEQLIDLFIGNSKERYATFESIRAFDASSPFYRKGPDETTERAVGAFLTAWIALEKLVRQRTGSNRALWRSDLIPGVSPASAQQVQILRRLRNELVHGIQTPNPESLTVATNQIKTVVDELRQKSGAAARKRRARPKNTSL
jgi:ppGpp synthetase/RelA/SpoT-type nucleotidyltranferase